MPSHRLRQFEQVIGGQIPVAGVMLDGAVQDVSSVPARQLDLGKRPVRSSTGWDPRARPGPVQAPFVNVFLNS